MAKSNVVDFPFYDALRYFYVSNKGKIRRNYKDITRKLLDYNDKSIRKNAYLRTPQFNALEMYIFLKEFMDNEKIFDIFAKWYNKKDVFSDRSYYAPSSAKTGQITMYDEGAEHYADVYEYMKKYATEYPNYIYALTMGLGKTVLMATCIFYEFLLASKYPNDKRFCHNVLVFAPDKTVLQSLREIMTFDKSKVIPKEYVGVLEQNIKFHFLDDNNTTLNTIDNSDFNIIISNTQKIILKHKNKEENAVTRMFNMASMRMDNQEIDDFLNDMYGDLENIKDEEDIISNQRFEKLKRLKNLGVYVDEAHHLFGKDLKATMQDDGKVTSLRNTINSLAENLQENGSKVVACYNFTGTPYVENSILPEVVSYCGLTEAISMEYLKQPHISGYENVKGKEFIRIALKDFFEQHGDKTYEGLLPKIAFFASTIEEAQTELKPLIEEVMAEMNFDINKVLINVGDATITKNEDIKNFNDLDIVGTEGSKKQVLILVNKGREGWNCRSLFAVAMYRSPKSTVFVLQATMRCLRKITDIQQTAKIYLSKENYDILDKELNKNFKISVKDVNESKSDKIPVNVKVLPPLKKIKLKTIYHNYELLEKNIVDNIDFKIKDIDVDKYETKAYELNNLQNHNRVIKGEVAEEFLDRRDYSKLTLVAEASRYLNIPCLKLEKLLENAKDGLDEILKMVSKYNDIVYDVIIPKIFNYYYEIKSNITSEEKEVTILDFPKEGDSYLFHCKKELLANINDSDFVKVKGKSFHTDNYCFDSKPEMQFFYNNIMNDNVKEIYFTGMFTSEYNGLSVQYVDPESNMVRTYYPDFIALLNDGTYQIIEIKGDNMVDDPSVNAKAYAMMEVAYENQMDYKFVSSTEAMNGELL